MSGAQATGQTVIFFRAECFYPLILSEKVPTAKEFADHAALNPGTMRIEDMSGNVIWPEGTRQ
ncbi:hypothetical protein [Sphingomonas sp. Leaf28]|uniref:hypothetical protein n=1 Tax=Sphingomonas sp. Leaf28 TaxID=1735695 RepID=UPI0006F48A4E|nr:hypothetical protein [Sphingomonas sp. Leaf28]KQN12033.1 hypothetical protein ASE79_08420 [Sphingomonas sp. Leaf28]